MNQSKLLHKVKLEDYSIAIYRQCFELAKVFRIARGAKTQADTLVVILSDGKNIGWAESVPYARYNESIDSACQQIINVVKLRPSIDKLADAIRDKYTRCISGAAKNALDCALLDLQAKQNLVDVKSTLILPDVSPVITAQTLSIDTPEIMAKSALDLGHAPLIKVKLDNQDIIAKMTAIHKAAPNSRFIVDANEGWTIEDLVKCDKALKSLNVDLIEQPLPAGEDSALAELDLTIDLCADESCHTSADIEYLVGKYDVVNIKLDKTGGLTEAVKLANLAQKHQLGIMLGCMVGSSLAMAPVSLLSHYADFVDLDGPLLIKQDRTFGFDICDGVMQPLNKSLWGSKSNQQYHEAMVLLS